MGDAGWVRHALFLLWWRVFETWTDACRVGLLSHRIVSLHSCPNPLDWSEDWLDERALNAGKGDVTPRLVLHRGFLDMLHMQKKSFDHSIIHPSMSSFTHSARRAMEFWVQRNLFRVRGRCSCCFRTCCCCCLPREKDSLGE